MEIGIDITIILNKKKENEKEKKSPYATQSIQYVYNRSPLGYTSAASSIALDWLKFKRNALVLSLSFAEFFFLLSDKAGEEEINKSDPSKANLATTPTNGQFVWTVMAQQIKKGGWR